MPESSDDRTAAGPGPGPSEGSDPAASADVSADPVAAAEARPEPSSEASAGSVPRRPGALLRARVAAIVMAALLLLYLVFAIGYAVLLISIAQPITIALGVALIVLPLLGIWALAAELLFAVRADRLAARLETEGGMPSEPLPVLASGRVDPDAADAVFPRYREAVEQAPDDWRAWFRLGLVYDASGDRRRARWATRQAIRFSR